MSDPIKRFVERLAFRAAPDAGGPVYGRLADGLRAAIADGRLPVGTRLPSERALALALGLSRTTVTSAYEALNRDGANDMMNLGDILDEASKKE